MKKWIELLKQTYNEWSEDNCLQMGAALSFYTLGSLVPLLLVITSIVTYVALFTGYGTNVTNDVIGYIGQNVGEDTATALRDALEQRQEDLATGSVISAIIGFVALLFTASGVFGQLDQAFDVIWDVPDEDKPQGILGTIKAKIFSFGMVLAVAFLLLVSTVLTAVLNTILDAIGLGPAWLFGLVNFAAQLALISFVFMLLFKYLPNAEIAWGDVALGGVLTAVLWVIGQQLLSLYFANAGFSSYGVIGGVLAFLVYVYYSSQIIFFGGEFTSVYARAYGSHATQPAPAGGLTPAGVLMVEAASRGARRREAELAEAMDQDLTAARTRQVAAVTTGGIVGLLAGAAIGGAGLIIGAARGVARLRGR
jgi:membrane protein